MNGGYRKGQARWNIILETGYQRELVGFAANYKVRYGEAWRCLDPAFISSLGWYTMPLWIKLETEPPIMSSILDLGQARKCCRCHDELSMRMHGKM